MRTETIIRNVYTFDELSDAAKETAREWYRQGDEYPWMDEAMQSIRTFCEHFGVSIRNYCIDSYGYLYVSTDAENTHFRGVKLRQINCDAMPTGYCLDNTLWFEFYDEFKRTGDALAAFNDAIDAAVRDIREDIEYHYSDECVDESILCNEYEFTEDGRIA